MSIRVYVNGAQGRMGQLAVKTIEASSTLTLAGIGGRNNPLPESIKQTRPDVVLDFTNANSVFENTRQIIEANIHPVIGTTGLLPAQIQQFQTLCEQKKLGGIIVPNFSIGAVLMMQFAKQAAAHFSNVEIIEQHHTGKQDAPSGTAIKTAEMIASINTIQPLPQSRETLKGARGASFENITIHSVRLPGRMAHQQVIFGGLGETLTIQHDSIDRQCFMPGIVKACEAVMDLKTLAYGLEVIINP